MIVGEIGVEGQKRLLASKVLVVGCGGLGAPVLLYLASMGVGTIGISDSDAVEVSNLNRQVLFAEQDAGRSKTEAAVERLRLLNRSVAFKTHDQISRENAAAICSLYDIVVDCADSRQTRYTLSDYCARRRVPFICGSSLRWDGAVYALQDFCYRCVHPKLSKKPQETCASAGIIGSMCGVVGSAMATEVLKCILGLSGGSYMVFVNGLKNEWMKIRLGAKERCFVCREVEGVVERVVEQEVEGDLIELPKPVPSGSSVDFDMTHGVGDGLRVEGENTEGGAKEGRAVLEGSSSNYVQLGASGGGGEEGQGGAGKSRTRSVEWDAVMSRPEEYLVVDIRTKAEHKMFGVPSSVLYSLEDIIEDTRKAKSHMDRVGAERNKKVALFCRNGTTSLKFSCILNTLSISGGFQKYLKMAQDEEAD